MIDCGIMPIGSVRSVNSCSIRIGSKNGRGSCDKKLTEIVSVSCLVVLVMKKWLVVGGKYFCFTLRCFGESGICLGFSIF